MVRRESLHKASPPICKGVGVIIEIVIGIFVYVKIGGTKWHNKYVSQCED